MQFLQELSYRFKTHRYQGTDNYSDSTHIYKYTCAFIRYIAYVLFHESDGYYPIVSELISGILVAITIYCGGIITLGIIACIKGYKCFGNRELSVVAYNEKLRAGAARAQQIYRTQSNVNVQQSFTTENTAWQCKSCGKFNESDNKFCIYCGNANIK